LYNSGAFINTDASSGDIFDVTVPRNSLLNNPTNPVDGKTIRWRITQDLTGSRLITLGSEFNIPSSAISPLVFSTTSGSTDILAVTRAQGRGKWDVIAFVTGY